MRSICVLQGPSPLGTSANKGGRPISLLFFVISFLPRVGKGRHYANLQQVLITGRPTPELRLSDKQAPPHHNPCALTFFTSQTHARTRTQREKRRQIDLKFALACESELQRRLAACLLASFPEISNLPDIMMHTQPAGRAARACTPTYTEVLVGWGVQIECK